MLNLHNQIISVLETRESVKDITCCSKSSRYSCKSRNWFLQKWCCTNLSTFGATLTEELIVKREDGKITEKFVNESLRKISVSSNEISNNVDFYIESERNSIKVLLIHFNNLITSGFRQRPLMMLNIAVILKLSKNHTGEDIKSIE